jgi:hypothetical protein
MKAARFHGRGIDRGFRELIDNNEENVKILVSPKELS